MKSDDRFAAAIECAARSVSHAIMPFDATSGEDATGGHVQSLTESVMGVTAGLVRIAEALDRIGDVYEEDLRHRQGR